MIRGVRTAPLISLLKALCILLAIYFLESSLFIAFELLRYPYRIEWIEGHMIYEIQRVREGLPIYAAPGIEYVPLIYAPLFMVVSAALSFITGIGFLPGRLVSLASILVIYGLFYLWMRREKAGFLFRFLPAGLFAATYPLSDSWFFQARSDSMALALVLGGMFVFMHNATPRSAALAAALWIAAYFTKQFMPLMVAPFLAAAWMTDCRRALLAGGIVAIGMGAGIMLGNALTDGWFGFYTLLLPTGHPIDSGKWTLFWRGDMKPLAFALGLAVAGLMVEARHDAKRAGQYAGLLGGMLLAGYAGRLHSMGHINVLMPAHAGIALVAGLTAQRWLGMRPLYACTALAALLLAFWTLLYSPQRYVPGEAAYASGMRFNEYLRAIPGEVLVPDVQFVQEASGKKSYALGMAALDLIRARLPADKEVIKIRFLAELQDAVRRRQFAMIIGSGPVNLDRFLGLHDHYRLIGQEVLLNDTVANLGTGVMRMYVPIPANVNPLPSPVRP